MNYGDAHFITELRQLKKLTWNVEIGVRNRFLFKFDSKGVIDWKERNQEKYTTSCLLLANTCPKLEKIVWQLGDGAYWHADIPPEGCGRSAQVKCGEMNVYIDCLNYD